MWALCCVHVDIRVGKSRKEMRVSNLHAVTRQMIGNKTRNRRLATAIGTREYNEGVPDAAPSRHETDP